MENRLPCLYLVDSGGAYLPLQVVLLFLGCYLRVVLFVITTTSL